MLEHAKDIAEVAALLSGGVYFGYKAFTGYLRVNLSLSVRCVRQSDSATNDVLVIYARMVKGANGSLTLHDVQAQVRYGESTEQISFRGIDRSSYRAEAAPHARKVIAWGQVSATSPTLKLVPGEETELAAYCAVPANAVCLVEVAVLGQQTNRNPFGQWKASCVSLPKEA